MVSIYIYWYCHKNHLNDISIQGRTKYFNQQFTLLWLYVRVKHSWHNFVDKSDINAPYCSLKDRMKNYTFSEYIIIHNKFQHAFPIDWIIHWQTFDVSTFKEYFLIVLSAFLLSGVYFLNIKYKHPICYFPWMFKFENCGNYFDVYR